MTEKDLLHQVLPRTEVIEEAICSLRNNIGKVTEKQSDMDKRFEDATKQLLNLNKQLSDLSMADRQQKKRLKDHIDKTNNTQAEVQQKYESRLESLEKLVQELFTKQVKLEEESYAREDKNEELERKIKDKSENMQIIENNISDLEARLKQTNASVNDLLNRLGSQEQVTQSVCEKVQINNETLETFQMEEKRNIAIVRKLEGRLQMTEKCLKEMEKTTKKKVEKMEEQFHETEISVSCHFLFTVLYTLFICVFSL